MRVAKHFDEGKTELQYVLAMDGLDEVAKVGTYGANKYGQYNYRDGSTFMRFIGSIIRHTAAFARGQDLDRESGFSHLAHVIYNCLILLQWIHDKKGIDDRYKNLDNRKDI